MVFFQCAADVEVNESRGHVPESQSPREVYNKGHLEILVKEVSPYFKTIL